MRFREYSDPFYNKQPFYVIGKELQMPTYTEKPEYFGSREKKEDEVIVQSARLLRSFPEGDILETAYSDFEQFLVFDKKNEESGFVFRAEKIKMYEEGFRLSVSENECIIFAGDTEGVRRAIYFLEDEMIRRGGFFLPKGTIERMPHIKRRITRNFFTPHAANRELQSEEDFYPDAYLNRLAHDGVNGLWIFLQLKDLLPSRIVPEYGQDSGKMLEKLRKITEKCARYGIRVYGLGVEPYSTHQNTVLAEKHADMLGSEFWVGEQKAVCPCTEKGKAYIEECMYTLFTLIPKLAGFIGITLGEAVAGCGSVATKEEIDCPHCRAKGLTKPRALAETERLLKQGMQKANPDAEFISWTYAMRGWTNEMQAEHCAVRDKSIPLMNNFEDKGTAIQLGKPRTTLDYWLSFAGPGEVFQNAAKHCMDVPLYAKIQVCSSHELATVPFVPVPGILYDKYRSMHEMRVEGAMYCWFFGNYPSLMNRAAGELGFSPFPETKEGFLQKLANLYTDEEHAKTLVEAWLCFEKGYTLCPYNVAFAWFGPLNDAPARPLHLLPIDVSVPSNWLLEETSEGDRFGEFTGMTHSPEEAEKLLSEMEKHWKKGLDLLVTIPCPYEMRTVSEAISILIGSAKNILSFYLLRNQLGYREGDAKEVLCLMEGIAKEEIKNSKALAQLCEKDMRLGYHSEAVGYKFFPEKLLWRAQRLREMLEKEFPLVTERIQEGKSPLAFYEGDGNPIYRVADGVWENFKLADGSEDTKTRIRVHKNERDFILEIHALHNDPIRLDVEFRMFVPYVPVLLDEDGHIELADDVGYFISEERKKEEARKWKTMRKDGIYRIVLSKEAFGLSDGKAFRIGIRRLGKHSSSWKKADRVFGRLMYGEISPDEKTFIL